MAIEIKTAMDWDKVESDLIRQTANIKNGRRRMEAQMIVSNIDTMISTLSKLELEARRSPGTVHRKVNEQLDIINQSVLQLEQWITMLLLM